jgi:hypothetical protein
MESLKDQYHAHHLSWELSVQIYGSVFEVYDMASKQKYDLALLVRLSSLNEIVGQRLNGPWPFLKEDLAWDIWETVEMVRLPDLLLFQLVSDRFP